jgi:17 kDa outer membrane surface antigen
LCSLLRFTVIGLVAVGGCSYQLSSLTPKDGADMEQTGALGRAEQQAEAAPPPEVDLVYGRAVAADALARSGKDDSAPWHNPNTGAGGNITPLAVSYTEGAFTCRDFLASYVRGQTEAWLQGEACRTGHGKWEVKSLTPLNRG